MNGPTKAGLLFSLAALFFAPPTTAAQTAAATGSATPAAAPASPESAQAEARAQAYYHFTVGHMYEEMAEFFRRSDYLRRAIDEYKEALRYDPGSATLTVRLADAYRRSGRIRDAVLEARQVLEKNPDDLAAHRLLGQIYYMTLGETRSDSPSPETLSLARAEFEQIIRLAPDDTDALLSLARLYRMGNDLRQAEATLKKLLALEPRSEDGLRDLAMLYSDRGDYEKAVELLQQAAGDSPSDKLLGSLAYAYEQADDYDNAIATYRRALQENEDNFELRRRLAETLLHAGRLDEALTEYGVLAEAFPDDAEVQLRLSQVYRHQRRFEEAAAALEKAKQLAPGNLEIGFNESLLYEAQGDFQRAIGVLSALAAALTKASGDYSPDEQRTRGIVLERLGTMHRQAEAFDNAVQVFQLLLSLGDEQARRGYLQIVETQRQARQLDAAVASAEEALERFPDDPDFTLQLAALLADRGELDRAVQTARQLLDGTPSDRQVYLTLAQIYERHKRYADAEAAVDEAERFSQPGDEKEYIHFLRGALYERQKKFDRAEEQFRAVLEADPQSAVTLNYLGYMFADQGVKLEESVALIQRALEIDPFNGAYLDSLGWAYFRLNQFDKAEEYLVRARERLSSDPTIHDHLGDLYYATGRFHLAEQAWERARQEWERAPATEFDAEVVARLDEKLRALKLRLAQETQKKPPK